MFIPSKGYWTNDFNVGLVISSNNILALMIPSGAYNFASQNAFVYTWILFLLKQSEASLYSFGKFNILHFPGLNNSATFNAPSLPCSSLSKFIITLSNCSNQSKLPLISFTI